MRRLIVVLIVLVGSCAPVFAQQTQTPQQSSTADWYMNKPIQKIEFTGLKTVRQSELQGIIDQYVGKQFTDALFLDLQRKLYALGYFEEIIPRAVKADPQGSAVVLQFQVVERPIVNQVVVKGNQHVQTSDILNVVLLKSGDIITQAKIRLDEDAILNLYKQRGYPNATVSGTTEKNSTGETNVVFSVKEGFETVIKSIQFSGNTFVSASTLRGVIKSKEQSLFNSGVYQEPLLEQDKQAIEKYYQDRGYIDAKVTDIAKSYKPDTANQRSYVTLTYYVSQGEQWTYGGIKFQGNSIFTSEKLGTFFNIQVGSVLDKSKVDDGYNQVANLYASNGYIFNQINLQEQRDAATHTISYVMKIVELNRAHIENIIIKGNTKTKDFVIRRELPFEVGDIFSAGKIREGLRNLTNLQYFTSITPETPQGSAPGLMNLVLNVVEANTANIQFGLSFGGNTSFPISGQLSWQDSNFEGLGESLGASLNVSPAEQTLTLNFLQPWLFGYRWSAGVNFSFDRALITGVPQDLLYPQFTSTSATNAVPDPFTGAYVFTAQTSYNGKTYAAGAPFPDPVNTPAAQTLISNGTIETDYQYAGGTSASIPSNYLMQYWNWNISLGANTGYRFQTVAGTLGLGTGLSTTLNYVYYNDAVYRPFDEALRQSHLNWAFTNKWSFTTYLDTRDYTLSPSSGYYLREDLTLAGGFLFGTSQFVNTSTTAEMYLTLWNLPVSDSWSWKMVLAAHSSLGVLLPQFWVPSSAAANGNPYVPNATDQLYIDGMFVGRGWPRTAGQALWDNWLELRMPVLPQIMWFDMFFEGASQWSSYNKMNLGDISNFKFTFGAGIRFTIPQFPIRLYIAKRFQVVNNQVQWEQGSLFNNGSATGGVDFVFSIGTATY